MVASERKSNRISLQIQEEEKGTEKQDEAAPVENLVHHSEVERVESKETEQDRGHIREQEAHPTLGEVQDKKLPTIVEVV